MDPDNRLVAAQAALMAGLAWPGRRRWVAPRGPVTVGLTAVGLGALGAGTALAALGAAPHGRLLTPRVRPPDEAPLLRTGAYAVSRNPIYAGLLLAGAGWALLRARPEPASAWAGLVLVLNLKVRREEEHLAGRFGTEYEEYRRTTPRFLPTSTPAR